MQKGQSRERWNTDSEGGFLCPGKVRMLEASTIAVATRALATGSQRALGVRTDRRSFPVACACAVAPEIEVRSERAVYDTRPGEPTVEGRDVEVKVEERRWRARRGGGHLLCAGIGRCLTGRGSSPRRRVRNTSTVDANKKLISPDLRRRCRGIVLVPRISFPQVSLISFPTHAKRLCLSDYVFRHRRRQYHRYPRYCSFRRFSSNSILFFPANGFIGAISCKVARLTTFVEGDPGCPKSGQYEAVRYRGYVPLLKKGLGRPSAKNQHHMNILLLQTTELIVFPSSTNFVFLVLAVDKFSTAGAPLYKIVSRLLTLCLIPIPISNSTWALSIPKTVLVASVSH